MTVSYDDGVSRVQGQKLPQNGGTVTTTSVKLWSKQQITDDLGWQRQVSQ